MTEDALIAHPDRAAVTLARLRELGARIYADDFGTGFANLAYLTQFPVDGLKIDMSFVKGLPQDRVARAIVEATIALGRSLGLHVVAEGVERPEQARFLAEAGCPLAQGYLFGRPEPAEDVDFADRDLDGVYARMDTEVAAIPA